MGRGRSVSPESWTSCFMQLCSQRSQWSSKVAQTDAWLQMTRLTCKCVHLLLCWCQPVKQVRVIPRQLTESLRVPTAELQILLNFLKFRRLNLWAKLCVCVYSKLQITYFSVVLVNFGNLATSFHLDSCCWMLTVIYVQYYMFFFLVAAGRSSSLIFQPLSILLTSSWATFTSRVSTDDTLLHVITHLTITAASLPHS